VASKRVGRGVKNAPALVEQASPLLLARNHGLATDYTAGVKVNTPHAVKDTQLRLYGNRQGTGSVKLWKTSHDCTRPFKATRTR
jgi:hypothetical protein